MTSRLVSAWVAVALLAAACGAADDASTTDSTAPSAAAPDTTVSAAPSSTATTTTTLPATTTSTTTTPAPSGPGQGNTVVIADDQVPPTLNPYAPGGDNFIVSIVAQALHTGIADIAAGTLERIPEVVVTLPTVANGGLTVNDDGTMTVAYEIRDEAQWADGTPISGDDFAFTYETLMTPEIADVNFGEFVDNPYALIVPESIEPAPKTFRFAMSQPTLLHEDLFRWLIPRHQVEGTNVLEDWNEVPWVSGGPFVYDEWDRGWIGEDGLTFASGRLVLNRNDRYWKVHPETGDPLPYLDGVEFRFIPEFDDIVTAFAGREVDVIQPPPAIEAIERLRALEPEGAIVATGSGMIWEHLTFQFGELNRNPDSLNRHVAFRRAVAHAIDREALVREVSSGYVPVLSSYLDVFLPELSTGAWDRYPYDPDTARELLDGLCAELGRDCAAEPPTIVFSTTSNAELRPRLANWLVDALAEVGIVVELDLEDSQLYFGPTLDRGDYDLGEWAWVGGAGYRQAVAIHDIFDPDGTPPEGSNYYRWGTGPTTGEEVPVSCPGSVECNVNQGPSLVIDEHTARFAELRDAMNLTIDEAELDDLLLEAEDILADQVVIIPLFTRLVVGAVWAEEVGGWEMNPTQAGHTWNIEEWYRNDK